MTEIARLKRELNESTQGHRSTRANTANTGVTRRAVSRDPNNLGGQTADWIDLSIRRTSDYVIPDKMKRSRDLGLFKSHLPTGRHNSITDIKNLLVGYKTIYQKPKASDKNLIRSGVTVVLPKGKEKKPTPTWAGTFALNGNGEMTGTHWINDGGYFVGPIAITNTHSVGMVHHSVTKWMINQYKKFWTNNHLWAMPVVCETYDGVLNDINSQPIKESHVFEAFRDAY